MVMHRKMFARMILVGCGVASLAAAFVFSCCVLPLHKEIHSVVPLCHIAKVMAGESGDAESPARPAEKKQDVPQMVVSAIAASSDLFAFADETSEASPRGSALVRGRRTHGATRCDQDVGLLTLLSTNRI